MRTCLHQRQPSGGRLQVPSNVSALSDPRKARSVVERVLVRAFDKALTSSGSCTLRSCGIRKTAFKHRAEDRNVLVVRDAIRLNLNWEGLGETEFYTGQLNQAVADYKKALELNPDLWNGLSCLVVRCVGSCRSGSLELGAALYPRAI